MTAGKERDGRRTQGGATDAEKDERSPEQIEADLARTRTELMLTVDELSDRVNPKAVLRRVFGRGAEGDGRPGDAATAGSSTAPGSGAAVLPGAPGPSAADYEDEDRRRRALTVTGAAGAVAAVVFAVLARRR